MINTDYCYCSGIGCKIRDKCKRYLPNPPDIPLWWIDAACSDWPDKVYVFEPLRVTMVNDEDIVYFKVAYKGIWKI